jgi:two-component system copper resistance phosphate regulon response regulator CusR
MRVLIVEDDRAIVACVREALLDAGYGVEVATSGHEAEACLRRAEPDVLIIDLGLPDTDGLDLMARLRASGVTAPFLILSARRSVQQRVLGLERGGDDYLTKPFALAELLARLRALRRRAQPGTGEPVRLQVGDLTLDLIRRQASRGEATLQLSPQEFALLEFLCRHAGRVVTRSMILDQVWRVRFDPGTNVVDVHIHRLRAKVDRAAGPTLIRTVRGIGYVLGEA